MPKFLPRLSYFLVLVCLKAALANPEIDYRRPSAQLTELAKRAWLPLYNVDPTRTRLMRLEVASMTPMELLAREEVNLAGLRMHTDTRAMSRRLYASSVSLVEIETGDAKSIQGLPESPVILYVQWSPDGKYLGTLLEMQDRVELWLIDVQSSTAKKLSDLRVQSGMDEMMSWSSDSQSIWVKTVPEDLDSPPQMLVAPTGVIVRQSSGESLPTQTYQGVLRTQHDVDKFEYFFNSRLTRISLNGSHRFAGDTGIYRYFRSSPDNRYLLVERLVQPWSFLVNSDQFAYQLEVLDLETEDFVTIASSDLAEYLPYGSGMVRTGARDFAWRSDVPTTVVWVEALDKGNSYEEAKYRDQILSLSAPFDGAPKILARLNDRLGDIIWHQKDRAILISLDWTDREIIVSSLIPEEGGKAPRQLLSFEMGDGYRHPGLPLIVYNQKGFPVIQSDESGDIMYMIGEGGSTEGDRPFMDKFNMNTKREKRIFHSKKPYFEKPVLILDTSSNELLVQRESRNDPPSFYRWNPKEKFHGQVTFDENPSPEMENVQRTLIRYKREDGLQLTANLYLPEGYNAKKDGPLPTLVWAYPRAYQTANNASQLKKSPYQFIHARWNRPSIWVTQGYAVVDDPAMSIIAERWGNPNDTFLRQLIESGNAIVSELVRRGVSEEGKIVIGGHSYGAFMTANLLAHTDSFCAGIARSGAYTIRVSIGGTSSLECIKGVPRNVTLSVG